MNRWVEVPAVPENFDALTQRAGDGCLTWMGPVNAKGYGRMWVNGVRWYAHRWAYTRAVGPIPEGLEVRHSCDNPTCVEPAHLSTGTHRQNLNDAVERRRWPQLQRDCCVHGHEYTEANTSWVRRPGRNPYRRCRTCRRLQEGASQ